MCASIDVSESKMYIPEHVCVRRVLNAQISSKLCQCWQY